MDNTQINNDQMGMNNMGMNNMMMNMNNMGMNNMGMNNMGMNNMGMNNMGMNNMMMNMNNMGMNNMGMGMPQMTPQQQQMMMMYYMNQMGQNNMMFFNNQMSTSAGNIQPTTNIDGGEAPESILRKNKTIVVQNNMLNSTGNMINITLSASTGLKVIIPISGDKTLQELFSTYADKVSIPHNALGEKIVFLFNGAKLDPNSTDSVFSKFRGTNANITVFDQGGVIGA